MDPAKITLSTYESALVQDPEWLLTKNAIIGKVNNLLGLMADKLQVISASLPEAFPREIWSSPAKISRGENYKGLPYNVLDYPRHFGKEDVFAVRTMFWWGKFFSVTLHIKGAYKRHFMPSLEKNWRSLADAGFYISTDEDEWRHDFEPGHYMRMADVDQNSARKLLLQVEHCKLAAPVTLDQWNLLPEILPSYYAILFSLLAN